MRHNFQNLIIWKRSRELVKKIYELTLIFPNEEKFGLTSQIRRSAVSIPSNIAEGCGRGTDAQLIHFLSIANGSLCELETQLYLAFDLRFISEKELEKSLEEVISIRKMTHSFGKSLER